MPSIFGRTLTRKPILGALVVGVSLLLFGSTLITGCANGPQLDQQKKLPAHHSEDGFENPYLEKSSRGFLKYLKMRFFGKVEFSDYEANAHKVPTQAADLEQIANPGPELQITWIGHATMLIQYRGVNILTDPIFSERASPVSFAGPKRHNPPVLAIEELPDIDYVVISHNHYDHLDKKTVRALGSGPLWLVPLGLEKWFDDVGIARERVMELDWWESRDFSRGPVTITATPAQHWSARTLWDRNETLWASWMIEIDDRLIWYSGDTGYNRYQFKEIGKKFPPPDLALISIGAYEPRWFMKGVHINPEEAVVIHEEIESRYSIGIQWGTFRLTAEPIDEPPIKLREALAEKGIPQAEFETMKIGETGFLHF